MRILCIGDVVGRPGREAVEALLPKLKEEYKIDFTIVNGENSAGGAGISPRMANHLLQYGCDVITLGDHTWDKREIYPYLEETPTIIRPLNFPAGTPGRGYCIVTLPNNKKIAVINLLGRVFMRYNVACPFLELEAAVTKIRQETPIIVVDMHAEATSEKIAITHFIDGRVSAVVGTHTHVQTADEQVFPKGTAHITDLGMTGPHDSVIGQNKDEIIRRYLTSLPVKFKVGTDDVRLNGVVIEVDEKTGLAQKIQRVSKIHQSHSNSQEEEE